MMKHGLFPLLFIINIISISAQEKCGTYVYEKYLYEKELKYKLARENVNKETHLWTQNNPLHIKKSIITIPVVVHVVWNTNQENISDNQIISQIDVLNADYRRTNVDAINTPSVWNSIAADCEIEFCLANTDPQGNNTTGITRTQTSQTSFSISSNNLKSSANGGKDPWPQDDYLNIWVCDLSGGILGYATPPSNFISSYDGVVIGYRYFGTMGTAQNPYNKGRTATHEVGHWLNLDHIWGDNTCGNDQVSDTPEQEEANYSCPSFPHNANSCGTNNPNGDMFMNYMDYTNDGCMNIFTQGQKTRMISAINQYRPNLLNHNLCGNTGPPVSFNCINGNCIDPGNGTGTYSNYNTCYTICNCSANAPPLNEDFQSGNINNSWSIINPDNDKSWEIMPNNGFNSSSSVWINNADYPANGEYDDLILPTLDLSSLSNANLSFNYAYSLWTDPNSSQVWSDTLQVWVSVDCGVSWTKLWEKSGINLVTTTPIFNGFSWYPNGTNDWAQETISLNPYLTEDDFVLKFRNVNDYENNLFLDNINISGNVSSNSWDCINNTCVNVGNGNGQYPTLTSCQAVCVTPASWDCIAGSCIDPGNVMGSYSSLTACQNSCLNTNIFDENITKNIYPNPANKIIQVNIEGNKKIYNVLGELLIETNQDQINIRNLEQGVYILQTQNKILKFIKK